MIDLIIVINFKNYHPQYSHFIKYLTIIFTTIMIIIIKITNYLTKQQYYFINLINLINLIINLA